MGKIKLVLGVSILLLVSVQVNAATLNVLDGLLIGASNVTNAIISPMPSVRSWPKIASCHGFMSVSLEKTDAQTRLVGIES